MKINFTSLVVLTTVCLLWNLDVQAQNNNGKSRIIVIGAHPDDCDSDAGGTATLLAAMGHAVKFVAVTNGDAGHHLIQGKQLAERRYKETQEVARRLAISPMMFQPCEKIRFSYTPPIIFSGLIPSVLILP